MFIVRNISKKIFQGDAIIYHGEAFFISDCYGMLNSFRYFSSLSRSNLYGGPRFIDFCLRYEILRLEIVGDSFEIFRRGWYYQKFRNSVIKIKDKPVVIVTRKDFEFYKSLSKALD